MTSTTGRFATAEDAVGGARRELGRLYPVVAGVVALGICLWRIGTPTYWRDESVSVVVGRSGVSGIREFTGRIDAVHTLYYLLIHLVTEVGTSEVFTRAPSAVAAALAAAGIAVLGRRLYSARAGLYGGLLYGLLPITSRYAEEVRQYALVSAGAVLASYLLLRSLDQQRLRAGWYIAYAASMGLLGWLHLYALFLLPAHAVTALLWDRRRLHHLVAWGLAAFAAVAAVLPLVLVARGQEGAQVSWLRRPGLAAPYDYGLLVAGGGRIVLLALAAAVVAGAVRLAGRDHRNAAALVVPWLIVPFVVAWTISQAHPVYHPRYVLYCVCALALLAGVGLEAVTERLTGGLSVAVLALACLAVAVLPAQLELREPRSRPDDLRSLAAVLRQRSRPGDAVLYVPADQRVFATVYADAFARLDAAALHDHGRDLPTDRFRTALGSRSRIWVVEIPPPGHRYRTPLPLRNLTALRRDGRFTSTGSWAFGGVRLALYSRHGG
ncbi:glycosyltransferase family 39 protein [Actinomadura opuntiae]|uniref:glycosyltransferase family 39 protein n=1 Tax=Actinomadura sp. OS1-43 TaxID=604315 RepID=UPI00255AC0F7|nr:glycosyltransferase family 39 protein [Actinomadura sp. OS1-43]MDL4819106.1 glycosyltransferase family 39 protein [Actinomadura sp. OS1-43]